MKRKQSPLDLSVVLLVYAVVAVVGGLIVAGRGPAWLGTAAMTRLVAAMVIASGCWAAGISQLEDPRLRQRSLFGFSAGHIFVLVALDFQRVALMGPGVEDFFIPAILLIACLPFPITQHRRWRGEHARSWYELQLREVGAQEERNRLARDLHDSIKQQIFVIQTAAATAQTRFDTDHAGAATALDQIRSSAREAMTEMEAMMDQLRSVPLGNAGLVEALKKQCEALGHRTGAHVEFKLGDLPPGETLAPGSHQAILRVAQEALANVGRHARAQHVTVSLDSLSDRLTLRIQDDGAGFDVFQSQRGMGISNMRARAEEFDGKFELVSRAGSGTTVTLSLPHDDVPEGYRKRAALWSLALIAFCAIGMRLHRSPGVIPIAICAIELIRNANDWIRARRYAEARA